MAADRTATAAWSALDARKPDHARAARCSSSVSSGASAGRRVECGTELPRESDLFLGPRTGAEAALGVVGIAEVVEERMEDAVQVLER
ncbi:hypothetical protein [Streptomyces sp. NPDC058632]|uniref:hypothetical protein n=1 Tax=unclassified Streptomyces TaxID=2593676 RepID=UPI0036537ED0